MVSPALNVARWSFFSFGIAYGLLHDRSLAAKGAVLEAEAKLQQKQKWVDQAKAEWAKLHPPKVDAAGEANLDDANFDPAKWIEAKVSTLSQ